MPKLTPKQQAIARDIFETVYKWGQAGIVASAAAVTYQKMIEQLLEEGKKDGRPKH